MVSTPPHLCRASLYRECSKGVPIRPSHEDVKSTAQQIQNLVHLLRRDRYPAVELSTGRAKCSGRGRATPPLSSLKTTALSSICSGRGLPPHRRAWLRGTKTLEHLLRGIRYPTVELSSKHITIDPSAPIGIATPPLSFGQGGATSIDLAQPQGMPSPRRVNHVEYVTTSSEPPTHLPHCLSFAPCSAEVRATTTIELLLQGVHTTTLHHCRALLEGV